MQFFPPCKGNKISPKRGNGKKKVSSTKYQDGRNKKQEAIEFDFGFRISDFGFRSWDFGFLVTPP
ncbi:hypothetical protein B0E43_13110 [Algoriphagus sp. A40]|nr:hypothetical protein B0E43_13110 [Algoriphagus sp. A40]